MDKKVIVVCFVIGLLGLLSAITGFAAESARTRPEHVENPYPSVCVYPSSSASGLGFTAAVALFIAQIIISKVTGCLCCRKRPSLSSCKCTVGVLFFIASWITCVTSLFFLLAAASFNVKRRDERIHSVRGSCYVVGHGVFSLGAGLSLASIIFGMVSYLVSNSEKNMNESLSQDPSLPIGQPQVPSFEQNVQYPAPVHKNIV